MLGLDFGTRKDRADRLEESLQVIRDLWTQPRTSFAGKHYRLQEAVAEPKPVQRPHRRSGSVVQGPDARWIAARYADVWNAAGGDLHRGRRVVGDPRPALRGPRTRPG